MFVNHKFVLVQKGKKDYNAARWCMMVNPLLHKKLSNLCCEKCSAM